MFSLYVVLEYNGSLSYEWVGNFFDLCFVKYLSSDYKFFYKIDTGSFFNYRYLDGSIVDFDIFDC